MVKKLGILGGMGPEATAAFYEKVIRLTPARKDQDHIPTIIYSNTQIPDRTESILKNDHAAITRELKDSASLLEKAGADFVAIPCNTSHFYIDRIRESVGIPVIDMIEETARHVKGMGIYKVALLATSGTVKSGIYQKRFEGSGIDIMIPDERRQQEIMGVIYADIKSGKVTSDDHEKIMSMIEEFRKDGARAFILGCTELPLLFNEKKDDIIDPMDVLASVSVRMAGK